MCVCEERVRVWLEVQNIQQVCSAVRRGGRGGKKEKLETVFGSFARSLLLGREEEEHAHAADFDPVRGHETNGRIRRHHHLCVCAECDICEHVRASMRE